jgi:hypothetical protein
VFDFYEEFGKAVSVLNGHTNDEIVLVRDFGFFYGNSGLTVFDFE